MLDLVVIGAGLAGLSAALTAAQAGLNVRVIAKGMGALHWTDGTIDVLGYSHPDQPVTTPYDAIDQLPELHPLSRMGASNLFDSITWLQSDMARTDTVYVHGPIDGGGGHADNLWLPSSAGAKRPTYMAPEAQRHGDLSDKTPMVIVGLKGMRDFFPDLIVSNLTKQGVVARAAYVPLSSVTERSDYNTVHLAMALDHPKVRRTLGQELAKIANRGERIGLPAILGYDHYKETMAELEQITGAKLFEIPTLPPSVPGIRLHRALCRLLEEAGVRVETGMEVIEFQETEGEITWVATETSARPLRHRARAYLLATGGVLGGGFTSDAHSRFWEVVFNLPLSAPAERSQWFRSEFLDPRGHPLFEAGVLTDDNAQPVDSSGAVVYRNLWAAGSLLANTDPIREHSLEGLAISTGRMAAHSIVANLQPERATEILGS